METTQSHEKQAAEFLEKVGATLTLEYKKFAKYFPHDTAPRDVYRFTLRRRRKSYTGTFGQSFKNQGQEPTAYDILSVLTKSEPGTFQQFCDDFGYDVDSISALATYKAVQKEWAGVVRVFGDVLNELAEIQ